MCMGGCVRAEIFECREQRVGGRLKETVIEGGRMLTTRWGESGGMMIVGRRVLRRSMAG